MPKKVLFSKELILDKAFELFKEKGIESISARNVGRMLDASPAPIYKSIGSMRNLKKELIKKAKDLFIEYLTKKRTGIKFLDIGMGISIFAREEKQLFLQVFSKDNIEGSLIDEFLNLIREEIKKDERLIRINKEKLSTRNPWVGVALLSALKQDFPFDWVNKNTFVSKNIKEDIERYTTARMKFSTELYSHFFDQYLHKSQRGRKSFIGKFLYLADLTRDERYWYGCKPTLEKFCKKYEIAQYQKIMVEGVEHIAIPFDVGKDLSDHIKKCTMIPQVRHSFYFSPVDE